MAVGASALKKMMTSKDANSVGQKDTTKTKEAASAPKKKTTSEPKTKKEVYVAADATYNNLDNNNVPSAKAAKQAAIYARRAAGQHGRSYSIKEDSSGGLKKKNLHPIRSLLLRRRKLRKSLPQRRRRRRIRK